MSLKIGKIFGVSINIHYSLLLIFFLIVWSLALGYMPTNYPGLSEISYWTIGLISGLLLIASVIIHELCHSVVARRLGIPVKRITLFFLGGAAELPEEPPNPSVEFKMAVVGPLSSFIIAAILGSLWFMFQKGSFPRELIAVTQYGAYLNLILGGFNLLPAFPLDGGRIFRSILWKRKGSLIKATRRSTSVGVGISYLMMFGGFLIMIFGGFFNGLWIIFIGWFIKSSAESGLSQTIISQVLSKTTVSEIMSSNIVTINSDLTIEDLVHNYFLKMSFAGYPVMENGSLIGMVTMDRIKNISQSQWRKLTIKDIMKPAEDLVVVEPEMPASDVMFQMSKKEVGRALVMRNNQLVGIISRRDLTHLINVRLQLEKM